jgi:hypothetical protein
MRAAGAKVSGGLSSSAHGSTYLARLLKPPPPLPHARLLGNATSAISVGLTTVLEDLTASGFRAVGTAMTMGVRRSRPCPFTP